MTQLFDEQTIEKTIRLFKMLSDKTRLSIMLLIKEQEMNVSEISRALNMEQSAISHQLSALRSERLVKSRREKRSVFYSPNDQHVYDILTQVIDHALEDDCNHTYPSTKSH
ncbi:MAG: winged helix-turn-helix transcriptional regulator [Amphibacillus sp.]|uniref:Putative ArsR family transcriptional regulator n=1 Tax=Amphibacillus xylanus (strain ATCC 51415 / DSM 6626 / JCM 7361 / LMG 17667 / NBRC 15112 / Ep01) TaxID=698758 RepID=K0J4N0_AMPXN|nr:metalloregulator ArsR/SmtB family transcription factor [Amphibacillus xylanus]NMA91059.1 winged helix-turn-helix transcriptional regulator [Amphibacillus sp.]BAM48287.1 putative ArsR family transcriptional regulator [Amphibacillus xylanus NBRC 15112]